jgi:protein MpaA
VRIPTYPELVERWKALRGDHVRVREVACVGAPRTLLCAEVGDSERPAIHLAAGVHGDEPAGVLALLALAQERRFDPRFSYRIWPCTNPTGFAAGTRENADGDDINRSFGRGGGTPEARAIVMANRDRKFVLALDLHEDDEASEPYVYEYGDGAIGGALVAPERVQRPSPREEAEMLGGLSLSLLLCRNAAERVLTIETPSRAPLAERVAFHEQAIPAALLRLL